MCKRTMLQVIGCSCAILFFPILLSDSASAFEDKDCARVETVQQSSSIDLKGSDSVDVARSKVTSDIVKQAIAQVIGYDVHSDRMQNTQIENDNAQEKYQDAEKAVLDGRVRVRITDEKRTALPSGQNLALYAEVKVCVPKPEAVRKAEKDREQQLEHPPKVVDPEKAVWFNPASGQPQVWYSKRDDGLYAFFDNPGFDPDTGETLRPISSKSLREWRTSLVRQKRDRMAQAEQAKHAAEQQAIDEERNRVASAKRADLQAHARENCDKLAANPNDPQKPRDISGAAFDDLRSSVDDAIQACEAAVSIEPNDRRLRYQLARAYSVNDPKKAAPLFKALCAQRYPAAFDNYGWGLLDRRVGTSNLPAALAFFRRGAQMGDSDAMVSLASYIQRNKVPGSSIDEAVKLYRQAAAMGNSDATKALEPLLAAQQQAEDQRRQEMQNAQAIMGIMGGFMGGVRR